MRLRDRVDRGFPSPLLLSYTSSSPLLSFLLHPAEAGADDSEMQIPASHCHWVMNTSSLRLVKPSSSMFASPLFQISFSCIISSLSLSFLSQLTDLLGSSSSPLQVSFVLPLWPGWLLFYQYLILFGRFLSPPFHSSRFPQVIGSSVKARLTAWETDSCCHDPGMSYNRQPIWSTSILTPQTNTSSPQGHEVHGYIWRWNRHYSKDDDQDLHWGKKC